MGSVQHTGDGGKEHTQPVVGRRDVCYWIFGFW
jgi:hypothetical protein